MPSKIIQNLEFVNSFGCANLVARERKHLASDLFSLFSLSLFRFGFLNWVRCKPVGPRRWEGADGSRSLCASSTHARNPAMGPESWTGSRSVLQYGTRIRDWVPVCLAIGSPFIVIY